jgi:hypothetical protein
LCGIAPVGWAFIAVGGEGKHRAELFGRGLLAAGHAAGLHFHLTTHRWNEQGCEEKTEFAFEKSRNGAHAESHAASSCWNLDRGVTAVSYSRLISSLVERPDMAQVLGMMPSGTLQICVVVASDQKFPLQTCKRLWTFVCTELLICWPLLVPADKARVVSWSFKAILTVSTHLSIFLSHLCVKALLAKAIFAPAFWEDDGGSERIAPQPSWQ